MSYYPPGARIIGEAATGNHRTTDFGCGCRWDRFYYSEPSGRISHTDGPTARTCAEHGGQPA